MRIIRLAIVAVVVLLCDTLPGLGQSNQNSNPRVVPPGASPYGNTYAQWSALWWRWFISLPLTNNPVAGADCSAGQVGAVWFLVGVPGSTTIDCAIPAGKGLFFPIINTECSDLESPPFFGATEADRRACAKTIVDGAAGLAVTIDGEVLRNLESYRASSPNFTFVAPDNNVLGVSAGTGQSVGDGFYLMLAPLSAGRHTVNFTGSFPAFSFTIETTYILTVGR